MADRSHSAEGAIRWRISDSDPLAADAPTHIFLKPVRYHPPEEGNFFLQKLDALGSLLLGIYISDGQVDHLMGSATMIAPGVALTAKHVLDDVRAAQGTPEFSLFKMLVVSFQDGKGVSWHIQAVTDLNGSDLSILSLSLRSDLPFDRRFDLPYLSLRLPKDGEAVSIFGFREINTKTNSETLSFELDLINCVGKRTDHFPDGRKGMVEGNHIAVTCNAPGGISGGPAFDREGNLVGVVSSSLDFDDGLGPTFISLLGHVFASSFPIHWLVDEPGRERATLLQIQDGFVNIVDRSRISVEEIGDGLMKLTYEDGT